ncbi:MAG: AAA family ATPase [Thermomicrobiales bacterium]
MQRLFILCGLPFSGKSTLAKAMAEQLDLAHVELDSVHGERGLDLNAEAPTREDWIEAYRASFQKLDEVLAAGNSAVFDATSYRKIHRQRLTRIAARQGVPATIVYVDVSEAEAKQRRDENRTTNARPHVRDEDFALVSGEMQPPSADEGEVIYHSGEPIQDWIEQIIRPLMTKESI